MMQWLLRMPSRKEGLSECWDKRYRCELVRCEGWLALADRGEWEYLARGGGEHKYAGSNSIDDVAWY